MALDTRSILKLQQVSTSQVRELQWGIDWWKAQYEQAKADEAIAWKLYDDAIENNDPIEEKNSIFIACKLFEASRIEAYHLWQECKRQYLELMN